MVRVHPSESSRDKRAELKSVKSSLLDLEKLAPWEPGHLHTESTWTPASLGTRTRDAPCRCGLTVFSCVHYSLRGEEAAVEKELQARQAKRPPRPPAPAQQSRLPVCAACSGLNAWVPQVHILTFKLQCAGFGGRAFGRSRPGEWSSQNGID